MVQRNIHETAELSVNVRLGDNVQIWQFTHIRENALIGNNVNIGRGVYIGDGVEVGNNCKIQNYALLYEPAKLEDGVFIGPGVILTNDLYPRAVNPDGTLKSSLDWQPKGVIIRKGASVGARSVCVAPIEIGAWALIAAGSTVTKNVPDFALFAGSPARQINWVGKAGVPLIPLPNGKFQCPITGDFFHEVDGLLSPSE